MKREMYYVANIRLPNKRAHGLEFLRMVEAFVKQNIELTLVVPRKGDGISSGTGIPLGKRLKIIQLPVVDILCGTSFGFNLRALSFMLASFLYLLARRFRGGRSIIYTIDLDQFSFCLLPFIGWPVFMEMHGSKQNRLPFRFFLKRARGVIAVSEGVKRRVSEVFGVRDNRILVLPNGVSDSNLTFDYNRSAARKKLGMPAERKICLYVGRIYDWKGLEVLPDAAEKISSLAHIYLIGGEAEELSLLLGRELPKNLSVIRPVSDVTVLEWLAAADVLLLTGTRTDLYSYYETSPMKLTEYMAARRPVIAARTSAIESMVSEREVIFYEPDDGRDLGEKIRQVLSNALEQKERVESAFEKVKGLTWSKRAEEIIDFMGF